MLIGLSGAAGAGKDTVADYLVDEYNFKRYAFADAVREVALSINPIILTNWTSIPGHTNPTLRELRLADYVEHEGWDWTKRNVPEARRLLQVVGTEAGRQVLGENVWVDIISKKWLADARPNAVVTDMRFPNEFNWVENDIDEVTVRIERPDNPNAIGTTHASEQHSFECQYTLVNSGTYEDLYEQIDLVLNDIQSYR